MADVKRPTVEDLKAVLAREWEHNHPDPYTSWHWCGLCCAVIALDLLAEAQRDTERLRRIVRRCGEEIPRLLENQPWGAYKGAIMEDGEIKAAIDAAKEKP